MAAKERNFGVEDLPSMPADLAAVDRVQQRQAAQQETLAGAGRADEGESVAAAQGERQVAQ